MNLLVARAWLIYDCKTFQKPFIIIRGRVCLTKPIFSMAIGRGVIALLEKFLKLSAEEVTFLNSGLESSGLPEEEDSFDRIAVNILSASKLCEKITESILSSRGDSICDDAVGEMFKPLGVYFDSAEVLAAKDKSAGKEKPAAKKGLYIR